MRRPPAPPRRLAASAAAAIVLSGAALSGCGEAIHNRRDDDAFLRDPAAFAKAPAPPAPVGTLFPTVPGERWRTRFTVRRPTASLEDDPLASTLQTFEADVVLASRRPAPEGGTEAVLEARPAGQSAPARTEVYRMDASGGGISLAGFSLGRRVLTLQPPVPLLRQPMQPGAILQSKSSVTVNGQPLAVTAYSRVGDFADIDLPGGKRKACRVDTTLVLRAPTGQSTEYPMVRWFAPGIGIVRQRFLNGDQVVMQEMLRYQAPGAGRS